MFSGIIEAQSKLVKQESFDQAIRIQIEKPAYFDDLKIGDSICTNGVCLTIEKFDQKNIQFFLGAETLKLIGAAFENWKNHTLNLERSLRLGDRVHGHLVTGHVDQLAKVHAAYADGVCWQMQIEILPSLASFFWKKGSVCLNGVSLTVNEVVVLDQKTLIHVCLIPETMSKTNLTQYKVGQFLNIEADYLAKAYIQSRTNWPIHPNEGSLS